MGIHFPAQYSLIKMKFLSAVLFTALLSAVVAGGKVKKLKAEIQALEEAFSSVLEDTEGAIANLTARLDAMAAERVALDQDHAWQALHGSSRCLQRKHGYRRYRISREC